MSRKSKDSPRAVAGRKFAPHFRKVFETLGTSAHKCALAVGTSATVIADRYSGRFLPSRFERALIYAILEDFEKDPPEKLRAFLERGIERLKKEES